MVLLYNLNNRPELQNTVGQTERQGNTALCHVNYQSVDRGGGGGEEVLQEL
jgi:hypothetical protein